jgi:hypothetical protein
MNQTNFVGFISYAKNKKYWRNEQMANIKVNDLLNLNLTGAELFNDSESFLTELNDENEQMAVIGGACRLLSFICCTPTERPPVCQ